MRILVVDGDADVRRRLEQELPSLSLRFAYGRRQARNELADTEHLDAVSIVLIEGQEEESMEVLRAARHHHPAAARIVLLAGRGPAYLRELQSAGLVHRTVPRSWRAGDLRKILEDLAPRRKDLLVAAADTGICELLHGWLADRYLVTYVHAGRDALQLVRELRPDGILLDVELQGMTGISLAWALKNDPRYRQAPVVFMATRDAVDLDAALWLRALADAVVFKPFARREIVPLLERHLATVARRVAGEALVDDDRRVCARRNVRLPGRLGPEGGDVAATILSLSPVGAFVKAAKQLPPGTHTRLHFEGDAGRFDGTCVVVYREDRRGAKGMGVEFLDLSPNSQTVLVRTLSH